MGRIANFFGFGRASVERKDTVAAPVSASVPLAYQAFFSPQEITPWMAWQLYKNVAPLAKVIDLIADEVARLEPLIKIEGKAVEDHPVMTYLRRPGFNRTRQRLIKELAVQYLVTGTAYTASYGNLAVPDVPIAFDVFKSQFVNPVQGQDMWTDRYWYTEGTRSATFDRDPANPRDFRWVEANGLSEIIPIYDMDGERRGIGLSRLNAVKYDVELRLKGIQHNSSVMDNAGRPSGVLTFKEQMNEEQLTDVTGQIKRQAQGPANAGNILVFAGGESNFTQMSQTAKDMDFAKLMQIVEDAIVSRYNVPVTLFRTEAQTNNNYETAWRIFYQMAVLPCFQVIWAALSNHLSLRTGIDMEIVHNELTNPILAQQALDKALKLYDHHLVSRNEAREVIGREPVLGGDTIYGSMSDVTQAEDYFTNHGINDPEEQDNSREAYHQARPEADPVNRAGAEESARAESRAENEQDEEEDKNPDKNPDKNSGKKPKKPDKSSKKPSKDPAKKPDKEAGQKAFDTLVNFADYIGGPATGPPQRKAA